MRSECPTDTRFYDEREEKKKTGIEDGFVLKLGDRAAHLVTLLVADLLSLDCPAVAMRLEDVMKAKSPQVLV